MEFIKPDTYFNFLKYGKHALVASGLMCAAAIASIFYPGPNYGIDFAGGTELQLQFKGDVTSAEVRAALESLGYERPDIVALEGRPNEFMIRIEEVSAVSPERASAAEEAVRAALGDNEIRDMEFSPGGDKVSFRLEAPVDPTVLQTALEGAGLRVRSTSQFGKEEENRYEAFLVGVGDELVAQLAERFGERGPEEPDRVEWVGPKAGAQLRTAAIKALLYACALIMVYVAFRFDLRFAPGGVVALIHDALITVGIYVLFQREFTLTTVAAILTVIGYSINDTIVIFDRVRENMTRMRDKSMHELMNISNSQMLSRTIITGGTTAASTAAFFIWGTPVIKDLAFALIIGLIAGTYSTIYISTQVTAWLDRRFFSRKR